MSAPESLADSCAEGALTHFEPNGRTRLFGLNPTLTLVANSSEATEARVFPVSRGPILPRFRPIDLDRGLFLRAQICRRAGVEQRDQDLAS